MSKKKSIKELEKEFNRSVSKQDVIKQIETAYEIAEASRKEDDMDNAISYFKKCIALARLKRDREYWCLSTRALAEIYAEKNDLQQATQFVTDYRNTAAEFKWASEIQLSYHVTAFVYRTIWTRNGKRDLLEKSYEWAIKSYKYLNEHEDEINRGMADVRRAGGPCSRLSALANFIGQTLSSLDKPAEANRFFEKALKTARQSGDPALILSALQVNFDNHPSANKLEIAKEMVKEANKMKSKKEKTVASMYLLRGLLYYSQDLNKARDECYEVIANGMQELDDEDREIVKDIAIKIWRLYKADRQAKDWERLASSSGNRAIIRSRYEKLGDFATDASLYALALRYYLKFEKYADTYKEKATALEAITTTFVDCLKKCRHLVEKLIASGLNYADKLITLHRENGQSTDSSRELRFELLLQTGISMEKAREELQNLAGICDEEMGNARAAFERFQNPRSDTDAEAEIECCTCNRCPLDTPNNQEVFVYFQEEARLFMKRNYKDKEGETELHRACRDGDIDRVRLMISELGFNVNEKDNANWTPLHEASSAAIAEVLLENGAKIDPKSQQSLTVDDESDSGGGCTPLMSACYYGNLSMIELLLRHGASVTINNDRGYTAVDFLNLAILNGTVADKDVEPTRILLEKMQRMQKDAGMQPRIGNPRPFPKKGTMIKTSHSNRDRSFTDSELPSQVSGRRELREFNYSTRGPSRNGNMFVIPNVECDEDLDETPQVYPKKRSSTRSETDELLDFDDQDLFTFRPKQPKRSRRISDDDDNSSQAFPDNRSDILDEIIATTSFENCPPLVTTPNVLPLPIHGPTRSSTTLTRKSNQSLDESPQNLTPSFSRKTKQIRVKVIYQNFNGTTFLNQDGQPQPNHLIVVTRNEKLAGLSSHSKCAEVLAGRPHLWFLDGCDVDKEMAIDDLAVDDGLFTIICQIKQISLADEYRRISDRPFGDIVRLLENLTSTSVLDASDSVLRTKTLSDLDTALTTTSTNSPRLLKLRSAELGKMVPSSACFRSWARRFVDSSILGLTACGITDEHISEINGINDVRFATNTLELSYNLFLDGQLLSSFITRFNYLKELDLSGTIISRGIEILVSRITEIQSLEILRISNAEWITSPIFEQFFNACPSLTTLICENNFVDEIKIEVASGVYLKKLSLSLCSLTDQSVEQLIEWIQLSQVEEVDLSGATLRIEHLEQLVESRRGKNLPLRFYNEIDDGIPPVDEIYRFFLGKFDETDQVRFRFSDNINVQFRDYRAFADIFLF